VQRPQGVCRRSLGILSSVSGAILEAALSGLGTDDDTAGWQGYQDRSDDTVEEGPRWRGRRTGLRSQGDSRREGAGGVGLGSLSALEARGARATSASSTTVAVAAGLLDN